MKRKVAQRRIQCAYAHARSHSGSEECDKVRSTGHTLCSAGVPRVTLPCSLQIAVIARRAQIACLGHGIVLSRVELWHPLLLGGLRDSIDEHVTLRCPQHLYSGPTSGGSHWFVALGLVSSLRSCIRECFSHFSLSRLCLFSVTLHKENQHGLTAGLDFALWCGLAPHDD